MIDQESLNQFKLIGEVQSAVSKASTLREALIDCMRIASERTNAEMCVFWSLDSNGDGRLHPVFWLGPEDLTSKACEPGKGIVGRVFAKQQAESQLAYDAAADPDTQTPFSHLTVKSTICAPLSTLSAELGCIQVVNKTDGAPFTQESADILDIMVMFATMSLEESDLLDEPALQTAQPIIVAEDITREFQNGDQVTRVLQGVNLNVYEGEFLAILGESGCGKSTFLNIIGGMDQATSGTFSFQGKDLSKATQSELTAYRRNNIGFIFQSYNLMPNLTALQNLQLIAELVDDPMDCREALKLVGLEERMDSYPSQLSGGQQQRVSIARALVKRPKVIFADEPTAALDYTTSIEVLQVLERVMAQGATLVMVTHNEEICRMANRVVRLRRGKTSEITINRRPVEATELVW